MAFYQVNYGPLAARPVVAPRLRAQPNNNNNNSLKNRFFYRMRQVKNRLTRVDAPREGAQVMAELQETVTPITISNAFGLLVDEVSGNVNDEQIDIALHEQPREVRDMFKKIPRATLQQRIDNVAFGVTPQIEEAGNLIENDIPIEDRFEFIEDRELIKPARRVKRQYKRAVETVIDKDIYYYMKIKYFMKERTPAMVNQIITDCRVYMNKQGSLMNTKEDYDLISSLVLALWLPSKEELRFRSAIKNPVVLDGVYAINQFAKGNLGHCSLFSDPTPKSSRPKPGLFKRKVVLNPEH